MNSRKNWPKCDCGEGLIEGIGEGAEFTPFGALLCPVCNLVKPKPKKKSATAGMTCIGPFPLPMSRRK